ncbi:cobalt ECF transporter T component CbiQ [Methanosarcinaceae archaeon]|nr:cobalt ECF transporter T component CbiQ [Methanosarcinaceae archaeon]
MADFFKRVADLQNMEQMSQGTSVIHKLHPLVKIVSTVVFIVAVVSFSRYSISALIPFFFYPVIMMTLSETPWKPVLYRIVPALPFALFGGVSNIIFDTAPAMVFGPLTVSFGMLSFVSILLKTVLTVTAVLILIATTPITVIATQLIRLHVPAVFVLQLTMTYRYISVLVGEVSTMMTAYLIRSPRQKRMKMQDVGPFIASLLLRSIDRAERVYAAMKCRGFDGVFRTAKISGPSMNDLALLTAIVLVIVLFRFVNISVLAGNVFSGAF